MNAQRSRSQDIALLVARLCMASLFLWSGVEKAFDLGGAAAFAASRGVLFAVTLMPLVALFEVTTAAMLIVGWRARLAAAALAIWMLILGPLFHQFWNTPPAFWQITIDDFFHHFVMIGGMIYVMVFGPGRLSFEREQGSSRTEHEI